MNTDQDQWIQDWCEWNAGIHRAAATDPRVQAILDSFATIPEVFTAQTDENSSSEEQTGMKTYKIYFASGDPLRTYSDEGDPSLPRPAKETFTAAEAADIVTVHPWAWIDRDGNIIVNTYRTRCGADDYTPVKGYQMAARLRAGKA